MPSEHIWMRARLTEMRDSANSAAVQLHGRGPVQSLCSRVDLTGKQRWARATRFFFTTGFISEGTDLGLCQGHFCTGVTCSGMCQSEGWNRTMEHVQYGGKVC